MAILKGMPGIAVGIISEGYTLQEYDDDETDALTAADTATKYVEARSGARFGIIGSYDAVTYPYQDDCVIVELRVDGNRIGRLTHDKFQRWEFTQTSFWSEDQKYYQDLIFAELQITEDAADKGLLPMLGHLGTITVQFFRANYIQNAIPQHMYGSYARNSEPRRKKHTAKDGTDQAAKCANKPLIPDNVVSEKTLKGKAVSHQTGLGVPRAQALQPIQGRAGPPPSTYLLDRAPIATFHFKYRSRAALQAMLVVPREPSPVPKEAQYADDTTRKEYTEQWRSQMAAEEHKDTKSNLKRNIDDADLYDDDDDGEVEFVGRRATKERRIVSYDDLEGFEEL